MIRSVKESSLPVLNVTAGDGFFDRVQIKELFAKAVKDAESVEFSVDLSDLVRSMGSDYIRDAVEGLLLAGFEPERFPAAEKKQYKIELTGIPKEAEQIVGETKNLMSAVAWARDMVNRPGNLLRPAAFADEVKKLFDGVPAEVEILDEKRLKELGMNAVLGVGNSSAYRPCLCIIRYRGNPADSKITGLVGKGVTCDTGGYCLKSASSMAGIKGDMGGGAAVAGAICTLAQNRIPVNVTALIPMVENRISDGSLLPGDVITSYSGRTIEVMDTDAEGRLILADAVSYAVRNEHVNRVLDIATLTGAVCGALGFGAAGMLCDDENFMKDFERAYEKSGERYLRFPIYPEYERMIESEIADIKNIGGKFAGPITAGLFIRRFADGIPWIHLDIAGTAWVIPPVFEYQSKGATGAGLTTLYYLCEGCKEDLKVKEKASEGRKE